MAKKPNIQPLGDRVLVQAVEESEQVKGGIIIPEAAQEKPTEAKVITLGTGGRDDSGKKIAFNVKVGDVVIVSKYGGNEIKYDDISYTIIREDDILGIVK